MFETFLVVATVAALAFLAVPLIALLTRTTPGELGAALTSRVAREAFLVSVRTTAVSLVILVSIGTPAAYLLARSRWRGRKLAIAVIELPLVLPPAVAGIALLAAFGRAGLLGSSLEVAGIALQLTEAAVVLAVLFVAGPFYMRAAIVAFEAVEGDEIDAARTLGASRWRIFRRIALPAALGGLGAGLALSWARGLGEFGATIMFAGNVRGVTQTLPLAIYAELERDPDIAIAIGALLVVISAFVLIVAKLVPSWRSSSTSTFRSEIST